LGNDVLIGEDGADTYVYNAGDGNDRIVETAQISRATPSGSATPRAGDIISYDNISFGAGITADNIIFTKSGADGEDLVISFSNVLGQIYIEGQFRNLFHGESLLGSLVVSNYIGIENTAIDEIRFADGTRWSLSDIYAWPQWK
jgi:Ca2+-binding RTX toxin-like protein